MAFESIQQAMESANPGKVSFQAHEDVAKASESLYEAILESIEQLIDLTKEDKSRCTFFFFFFFSCVMSNSFEALDYARY